MLDGGKASSNLDPLAPGPAASPAAPASARSFGQRVRHGLTAAAPEAAVCLLALAVRLVFVCKLNSPADHVFSDMWVYDHRANNLLSGSLSAWDTFTPVGYPAFLALVYRLGGSAFSVGVIQAVLGAATTLFTQRLAAHVFARRAVTLTVGVISALHVPAIYYAGFLLTETLFSFLLVAGTWLLVTSLERRSIAGFIATGLVLGAGASVRPNLLVFMPCVPLLAWLSAGRLRAALLPSLIIVAAFAAPVSAAALHNARLVGQPTLGTNGGLNFYLNFAPVRGVRFADRRGVHRITPIPNLVRYPGDEYEEGVRVPFYADAHYYARGLALLRERPQRLLNGARNLQEAAGAGRQGYWPGDPRQPLMLAHRRVFLWAAILPSLAGIALLAARRRHAQAANLPLLASAALVLSSVITLVFFLGDPRMRVPFDPLILLLAAAAYVWVAGEVRARLRERRA